MAQGKQTSFGNGEVSPEIHFLSSSKTYANSLSRLKNGFVRYMGGVSNRAGSELLYYNPYSADKTNPEPISVPQANIPEVGGDEAIVGYSYWNSVHEVWDTLEVGYFYHAPTDQYQKGYRVNYGTAEFFYEEPVGEDPYFYCVLPEPSEIRFVTIKDTVLITPNATFLNANYTAIPVVTYWTSYENLRLDMTSRTMSKALQSTSKGGMTVTAATPRGLIAAGGPWLPVTYLFTATTRNDEELVITCIPTKNYDPSTWNPYVAPTLPYDVLYPHAQCMVDIGLTLFTTGGDFAQLFKKVTLYRATGASGINGSMFKKVGDISSQSTNITINDQGQSTVEITPPIDYSFMSLTNPGQYIDPRLYGPMYAVAQVSAATYYQQRLITAYKANKVSTDPSTDYEFETNAGDMMASKLGAAYQLAKPLIVSETEAFQFAPPVADGSEVVGFLSMERLIALTERAAYGYMGGDNGVFSPFTLNPVKLSDTGCSRLVEPKTANGRGYYVSPDQTKIMGVLMNNTGQVKVFEASKNASHLLKSGVRKMELISGQEDTLVLLRRDGVVITITVNIEGVDDDNDQVGFSTYEVATGFVENIYKTKMRRNYVFNQKNTDQLNIYQDVIVMYVIRDGVRYIEVIKQRDDETPEAFVYSDLNVPFGYRLADNGLAGYKKIYWQPYTQLPLNSTDVDFHINLGDEYTTGWSPEDQIPLYSAKKLFIGKVIFYYGNDKYPRKFTYTITPDSEEDTGLTDFPYKYSGYVNTDVPTDYRDVKNSAMTTAEKNEFWTRWCPAITDVMSPMLSSIWWSEKSKYSDERVPVSVYADSQILSSPNNPNKQNIVCYVERDESFNIHMSIPEGFDCGWGNIGLPYEFDMTSMRLEAGDDSVTLQSANKLIDKVGLGLADTQGGFIGIPGVKLEEMQEMEQLLNPNFEDLPTPKSGYFEWSIPTTYTNDGKVSVKHVDPSPITVLALYPAGIASGG